MKLPNKNLITLLACLIFSQISFADLNFTGVWQLDLNASESVDEILKAQGKSRVERMVARSMAVTQSIQQHGNQLSVHIKSKAMDNTQLFALDNQWKSIQTPRMGFIQAKSFISRDNNKIVTVMKITAKGKPALMTVFRSLEDNGHTMILRIRLKLESGSIYTARRVFRRV